jgi:hypothetical protein
LESNIQSRIPVAKTTPAKHGVKTTKKSYKVVIYHSKILNTVLVFASFISNLSVSTAIEINAQNIHKDIDKLGETSHEYHLLC